MCNITGRATRQIAKEMGCDITWSEMISSEGLVRQKLTGNKSLRLAKKFSEVEIPYWTQIFGANPQSMARAAKIIEEKVKPTGIDINLGCPVPKAQKNGYGAIQIANIPQVVQIIQEIKQTINLPLSLKTRLGLQEPTEILEFAPKLVKAGLDQLVVHARTLRGMFSAEPRWEIVKRLNDTLNIPVIYNGGIKTPEDAHFYWKNTGCQNLMIGQATIGRPWLFAEIKHYLQTGRKLSFPLTQKKEIVLRHARLFLKYQPNSTKNLIPFRAQLAAYFRNMAAPKKFRQQAVQIKTLNELKKLLKRF